MTTGSKIEWPQGNPLFEVQWRAVSDGLANNGVQETSDLEMSLGSGDMDILVEPGSVVYEGVEYTLQSQETLTLSASDPDEDRWDTIYFNTQTTQAAVREGTAEQYPEPPDIQNNEFLLGVVYIPAQSSLIETERIFNWRASYFPTENIIVDVSSDVYDTSNLPGLFQELEEAAQISSYPLAPSDIQKPLSVTDEDYTVQDEEVILVDSEIDPITITLPDSRLGDTDSYDTITVIDYLGESRANNITVETEGESLIDGQETFEIRNEYSAIRFISGASSWYVASGQGVSSENTISAEQSVTVEDSSVEVILINRLEAEKTLAIDEASFTTKFAESIPEDVDLQLVSFDNQGGFDVGDTVLRGDGSTVYDSVTAEGDDVLSSISNSSETDDLSVGVLVQNTSGLPEDIFARVVGRVVEGIEDFVLAQMLSRRQNDISSSRIEESSNVDTATAQYLARRNRDY